MTFTQATGLRDNGRVSGIARQRLLDLTCFFSGLLLLVVSFGIAANGSELPMLLVYLGLFLFASPGLWTLLRLERRGQDRAPGPLSEDEFARRCEELMRPKADDPELLPEALPKSLRDEGFTRDPGLFAHFVKPQVRRLEPDVEHLTAEQARARAKDGWVIRPSKAARSPRAAQRALEHDWPATARARAIGAGIWTDSDEQYWHDMTGQYTGGGGPMTAKVGPHNRRPKWLVADREFTPYTHCPAGHIATHRLTGRDEHEGQDVVLRECWYGACGLTWAEKAWTVGETA